LQLFLLALFAGQLLLPAGLLEITLLHPFPFRKS
jgi:hypothetical protein